METLSRRDLLKTATSVAFGAPLVLGPSSRAQGKTYKIGLIGCGGRGAGAPEAAIKAGKHAFIEKPVAVDPPGCRRVLAAAAEAKRKGLAIIAGTEMRHD